jgi:hypothetical protein
MLKDTIDESIVVRWIPNMPYETAAVIVLGTNNTHILYIGNNNHPQKYWIEFSIEWLKDDHERIDWLAWVLGISIKEIYEKGYKDGKEECLDKIRGIGELIKDAT